MLKYTDLIKDNWYMGKFTNDIWIFKFSKFKGNDIWGSKWAMLDGYVDCTEGYNPNGKNLIYASLFDVIRLFPEEEINFIEIY